MFKSVNIGPVNIKQIFIWLMAILFVGSPFKAKESLSGKIPLRETQQITLLFMGDIMQHMPQVEAAWDDVKACYNYDTCFSYVKPYISDADIAVANLETTLAGKPYSGYPAFSSPDALLHSMLWTGIDVIGTANNHCCDRGKVGIERTITMIDSIGFKRMGTYIDMNDCNKHKPLIVTKKGFRLAFLNYTYGTNGIPIPENNIVNLIDKPKMKADLQAAKDSMPDKIIVFIHWGEEYQRKPNLFQKDIAAFLFQQGADIIIGSHPHVIQHFEWMKADSSQKEKLLVWSLGNFVSNQRKQYTDGGAMVSLTLEKRNNKTCIANTGYRLSWVHNPIVAGRRQYYILPAAQYVDDTVLLNGDSRNKLKIFLEDSRKLLDSNNINVPELR